MKFSKKSENTGSRLNNKFLYISKLETAQFFRILKAIYSFRSTVVPFHLQILIFNFLKFLRFSIFKGTVSRDFLLLVFFMNQFSPILRVSHQDRFEFFRNFAEVIASQGAPPVSTTPAASCHRNQRHRWQILPPVSLVLLTPVANTGNNIRLQIP